jgi:hypothetical protein
MEDPASAAVSTDAARASEQGARAEAMVACLNDKDVPAVIEPWEEGQARVSFEPPEELWKMCRADDGMCALGGGEGLSQAAHEERQRVMDGLEAPYWEIDVPPEQIGTNYLIVGGADFTEPYEACLSESGYTAPITPIDPAQELEQEQAQADAANAWAACARENGLPRLKDADPPKADDYQTHPLVVLPHDISKELLQSVVEACPPFDREAREADRTPTDPSFGFDVPGWDGQTKLVSGMLDRETSMLISELMAIISEPRWEWTQEHPMSIDDDGHPHWD